MPDPLGVTLQSLLSRVSKLEALADGTGTERIIRPPRPESGMGKTSRSEDFYALWDGEERQRRFEKSP